MLCPVLTEKLSSPTQCGTELSADVPCEITVSVMVSPSLPAVTACTAKARQLNKIAGGGFKEHLQSIRDLEKPVSHKAKENLTCVSKYPLLISSIFF